MVDKICLGTVQLGKAYGITNTIGKTSKKEAFKILDYCVKRGINWLDTAEDYGTSQKIIGDYIKHNPGSFKIQSKISGSSNSNNLSSRFQQTLDELNVEFLDSYLFHSYRKFKSQSLNLLEETLILKKKKLCKKVGVSIYSNNEALDKDVIKFTDEIQFPYNVFDNFNQRRHLIKELKKNSKTIQIRSIFLQGLVFMNHTSLPNNLKFFKTPLWELNKIAAKHKISIAELALHYAFYSSFADKIIIGVESLQQLIYNLSHIDNLFKRGEDIFNEVNVINITKTNFLNPSNWNV